MENRRIYLYLAILIPIIMIIILAVSILSFKQTYHYPNQNFLYAKMKRDNYYDCYRQFQLKHFKTDQTDSYKPAKVECETPLLFVYDFATKQPKPITVEEADKLTISAPYQSSVYEGYRISPYCSFGSPMGWWWNSDGNGSNVCLIRKGSQQKLNITVDEDTYFIFIGWITSKK